MNYRLSSAARCDLKEISRYLGARNLSAAERTLEELLGKFVLLDRHPQLGPPRNDLLEGMRHSVVGNYVIFYRPTDNGVDILRVIHGSRDLNSLEFD